MQQKKENGGRNNFKRTVLEENAGKYYKSCPQQRGHK